MSKENKTRKISVAYKVLLIFSSALAANLICLWLLLGNQQVKSISEISYLRAEKRSGQLNILVNNVFNSSDNILKNLQVVFKRINNEKSENKFNTMIVFDENLSIIGSTSNKSELDSSLLKSGSRALLLKELNAQRVYINIWKSRIDIFLPLDINSLRGYLFYASYIDLSIAKELSLLFRVLFALGLVTALFQTLFLIYLFKNLIKPIKKLDLQSRKIAGGDLESSITVPKRNKDEITQLIFSFNAMTGSLKERTSALKKALHDVELKNKIMTDELLMGREIQENLLPERPVNSLFSSQIYFDPLMYVSGDFYDYHIYDDGSVGFFICDASGHGVPAAFITMIAKLHFVDISRRTKDPAELFHEMNEAICREIQTGSYLTGVYIVITPGRIATMCCANHPEPLLLKKKDSSITGFETKGFFVGSLNPPPFRYENAIFQLNKGDRMLFYTDGINEAFSPSGEQYGIPRLKSVFSETSGLLPEVAHKTILESYQNFIQTQPPEDDRTLILLELK